VSLGLYFVKVMMEEYGGSVRFEENEQRGAAAILDFPPAPAAESDAAVRSDRTSE